MTNLLVEFEDYCCTINTESTVPETNLPAVIELHYWKLGLEAVMKTAKKDELKEYDKLYDGIEFSLQDAWGFKRNKKHHRFWNRPRCICPHMDNEDRYPWGYYIKAKDCPLHGW